MPDRRFYQKNRGARLRRIERIGARIMAVAWNEQRVQLGEVKLRLWRGGPKDHEARPVLVLHHDIGTPDRLPFYDALAEKFDVIVPNHPGFGEPERPNWMRHPRDIAALYQWLLADLGVERAGLIGLGFGGWGAAVLRALALCACHGFVLVGKSGVRRPERRVVEHRIACPNDYAVY